MVGFEEAEREEKRLEETERRVKKIGGFEFKFAEIFISWR